MKTAESAQGSVIKRILGFPVRSHHSCLLTAAGIHPVKYLVDRNCVSLWKRIFQVNSPARILSAKLLTAYINKNTRVPGTLLDRILKLKLSPVNCIFSSRVSHFGHINNVHSGVVDSLKYLICHDNFIKPYSEEHVLATLLTRAFWVRIISSSMQDPFPNYYVFCLCGLCM